MGNDFGYVIDTSALMHDPSLLKGLGSSKIYLHDMVLDELDRNRSKADDFIQRANARRVVRELGELLSGYDHSHPIPLNQEGGTLQFIELPEGESYSHADPALIDYLVKEYADGRRPVLITDDIGLRVKAQRRKIQSEGLKYDPNKSLHETFRISEDVDLPCEIVQKLRDGIEVTVDENQIQSHYPLHTNQYLTVRGQGLFVVYRKNGLEHTFQKLIERAHIGGIGPRNKEQRYIFDLCLDPRIEAATVLGKAGTGKTIVTFAAALHALRDENSTIEKVVVVRPLVTLGRDVGYLPGDLEDKIGPYIDAFRDAANEIFKPSRQRLFGRKSSEIDPVALDTLMDDGMVEFRPPSFMRGRSLPNTFYIIDEAQNLTPHEMKTLISRLGKDSVVVATGDPYQIDHSSLDLEINGLTHFTRRFLGQDNFTTVIATKGERSRVAEQAANLL